MNPRILDHFLLIFWEKSLILYSMEPRDKLKTGQHDLANLFRECRMCPRSCGIDRTLESGAPGSGFCKMDYRLRVAYVGPHFGEEPPITGTRGSGTVFFSGCSLKCSFCQNHQISLEGLGQNVTVDDLLEKIIKMIRERSVHNINFVTADHFFPYTFQVVTLLRERGYGVPIVYNLSGYQSRDMLLMAEEYADIYLPDFKYADPILSRRLSRCRDYPRVALEAIAEMVRQKGFLDSVEGGSEPAARGVLVRHLILPGKTENSLAALDSLFLEFGAGLPLSIMSQYQPVLPNDDRDLNRPINRDEFDRVYSHAMDLGFENLFVQFPETAPEMSHNHPRFLPDFLREEPFPGNS